MLPILQEYIQKRTFDFHIDFYYIYVLIQI